MCFQKVSVCLATDMAGMLGHLFREQEAREERQRMRREYGVTYADDELGSFDDGDPYTTNLYVGNLAPTVDEDVSIPQPLLVPALSSPLLKSYECGMTSAMMP